MRVNPDVDAATHPYISTGRLAHKFGIDISAPKPFMSGPASLKTCCSKASAATSARS
jgi:diaminopimelate decarboxylase